MRTVAGCLLHIRWHTIWLAVPRNLLPAKNVVKRSAFPVVVSYIYLSLLLFDNYLLSWLIFSPISYFYNYCKVLNCNFCFNIRCLSLVVTEVGISWPRNSYAFLMKFVSSMSRFSSIVWTIVTWVDVWNILQRIHKLSICYTYNYLGKHLWNILVCLEAQYEGTLFYNSLSSSSQVQMWILW